MNHADLAAQAFLRRQIGMVTQETAMFNRSALDNIRYGRPDATLDEVIAAAEKAEAHEFIQSLRDHMGNTGYDAHLGERGVKLSGGQRQRIALARAILKDAPILVLDEATSALDSEVEAAIQSALDRVMEGKTVMAIAHRLSTLSEMDRIIVLDHGRIAEAGTHDALLAQNNEKRMVVEIRREARSPILVACQQPPVDDELVANEICRDSRGVDEIVALEHAAGDCQATNGQRIPGRQLLVIPTRMYTILPRLEQYGQRLANKPLRVFNVLAYRQVPLALEICLLVEPEATRNECKTLCVEQVADLIRSPDVELAFLALRVRIP